MSDYISRQAALDGLNEQIAYCDKALGSFEISMKDEYAVKVERASLIAYKGQLESIPAADVAPVVHGKWIPHSEKSREYIGTVLIHVMYDYWLCDTCGYRVEKGQPMYNFCPNCGAKMEE